MLSAYEKNKIIDALPVEGSLKYTTEKGEVVQYRADAAARWSLAPLEGKTTVPPTGQKRAVILHGAPGVGKSRLGIEYIAVNYADELDHFAIISYDERGAIYDIPEYVDRLEAITQHDTFQHTPTSADTFLARHQLWLDVQPLSQHIRALTLKEAARRDLSLFIDTTSSSPGTLHLINALRDLEYTDIEIVSVHAGLEQSADRIIHRLRPTSANDLLVKRVGAYDMLPQLTSAADRLTMWHNPDNTHAPKEIARFEGGSLAFIDPAELKLLTQQLFSDAGLFADATAKYLPEQTNLPNRYANAVGQFRDWMERFDPLSQTSRADFYYQQEMQRQP